MFALRPTIVSATTTSLVPEPMDRDGVEVDDESVLLVPHSKYAVVGAPFGFTVPLSAAEFAVTEVAVAVVAAGKGGAVVKLKIDP